MAVQSPYQGGMQTNIPSLSGGTRMNYDNSDRGDVENNPSSESFKRYQQLQTQSGDSDYQNMLRAQWERDNPNAGTSGAEQNSLYNMYKSRVGLKNALGDQISNAPKQLQMEKDSLNQTAAAALDQGTRNTKQNYNSRGLLYSGMREGGEQAVRGAVAGQLASGMAGAERESNNATESAKSAYESIGLADQQENLRLSNQAFDTASANNIARLQAVQQLGYGLGQVAGTAYGSRNSAPTPSMQNPTTNWNPNQMQMPQVGSQYGGSSTATSYGLLGGG